MNRTLKILLGTTAAATIIASAALATQSIGVDYNAILSTGTAIRDIQAHGTLQVPGMDEDFTAVVDTAGASNIIQQEVKFAPGGTTGWHRHPGVVLLTLAADSGTVEWYDSKCGKTVYKAGDSWTEGTKLHDVVNRSPIDAHFLVTYIVAKDVPPAHGRTRSDLRCFFGPSLEWQAAGAGTIPAPALGLFELRAESERLRQQKYESPTLAEAMPRSMAEVQRAHRD